jgi:hypothetical protein
MLKNKKLHLTNMVLWSLSVFFLISMQGVLFSSAHSPASVTASYNTTTQQLMVQISHSVSNPSTHYISTVEIRVNGLLNSTQSYSSQPSSTSFTYTYDLMAAPGDLITVTATCNQGGSRSASTTVPSINSGSSSTTSSTTNTSDPVGSIAGFELIFVIFGFSVLFGILMVKRRQ